jgi:hypothetical protein
MHRNIACKRIHNSVVLIHSRSERFNEVNHTFNSTAKLLPLDVKDETGRTSLGLKSRVDEIIYFPPHPLHDPLSNLCLRPRKILVRALDGFVRPSSVLRANSSALSQTGIRGMI